MPCEMRKYVIISGDDKNQRDERMMKQHALFVGVNDYVDTAFKNLRYSLSDAVALSGAFAARGFDVEILSNPKTEVVLGAVERKAAGLGPGDVFIFFFAGHGFTAPDGSHLLICANDRLAYLRHNRAGIPVDLLEEVTNGCGCNRAFLLDACRTDVFAGVENRGAETRDLANISLPDAKAFSGTCCVLRSCDRFCPAMEFDDLGHGVFTRAIMDVIGDASFFSMPFGETYVSAIRSRMRGILVSHNVEIDQNPCFQTNGEAFFLFDGAAGGKRPASPSPVLSVPLVVCPLCGKKNDPKDTFKCRECGRDNLCLRHQDETTFLCAICTAEKRKAREQAEGIEPKRNSRLGTGQPSGQQPKSPSAKDAYEKGENFYYGRNGFAQSYADAVSWYRLAAEQGHADAQFSLGCCYQNGQGVAKDDAKAVKWYRKAAEQGNAGAQCNLGFLYDKGRGVEQDYREALRWYRKAAEQGNANAQSNIGVMYETGHGVAQDYSEAANWYRKAIANGDDSAKKSLNRVEQKIPETLKAKTLGTTLREARLAKGYSIEQVAEKAKMLDRIVREIENDDFHRIPAPIYGRGFVRLYAECVGLDPKPLIDKFMAEYNGQKS